MSFHKGWCGMNVAAIVYDFDGTLSPGSMQEHSFIPELGYDNVSQFWADVSAEAQVQDGDRILTYMQLMLAKSMKPFFGFADSSLTRTLSPTSASRSP